MYILRKYRTTASILIFTVLFISSSEYFHHHTDPNFDENNCPVCLIIHSFSKADIIINSVITTPSNYEFISFFETLTKPELNHPSAVSDRSPPSHS
jgi:predicted transcriptional regulator